MKFVLFALLLAALALSVWKFREAQSRTREELKEGLASSSGQFEEVSNRLEIKNQGSLLTGAVTRGFEDPKTREMETILEDLYNAGEEDRKKLLIMIEDDPKKGLKVMDKAMEKAPGGMELSNVMQIVEASNVDPEAKLELLRGNLIFSDEMRKNSIDEKMNMVNKNLAILQMMGTISGKANLDLQDMAKNVVDSEPDPLLKEELLSAFAKAQSHENTGLENSKEILEEIPPPVPPGIDL
jgi:hypothetical protein